MPTAYCGNDLAFYMFATCEDFSTTTHVSPSNYDNPMSHVVLRVIKELPADVKQFSNFRKKHEVAATILGVTADKSQVDI